jgi:hypothetical protein
MHFKFGNLSTKFYVVVFCLFFILATFLIALTAVTVGQELPVSQQSATPPCRADDIAGESIITSGQKQFTAEISKGRTGWATLSCLTLMYSYFGRCKRCIKKLSCTGLIQSSR